MTASATSADCRHPGCIICGLGAAIRERHAPASASIGLPRQLGANVGPEMFAEPPRTHLHAAAERNWPAAAMATPARAVGATVARLDERPLFIDGQYGLGSDCRGGRAAPAARWGR